MSCFALSVGLKHLADGRLAGWAPACGQKQPKKRQQGCPRETLRELDCQANRLFEFLTKQVLKFFLNRRHNL